MKKRSSLHRKNLHKIFYPDSVAIVGANKVKGTVPYDILMSIVHANFNGVVFPVSPGERFIAGIRTYKYVIDIQEDVDLAILVFPSAVCHLALEQCGKKGIKSVIIISAGFREIGEKGLERERQILSIAEKYDISFIGPNCLGVINTDPKSHLNASFARKMPEEGPIGFLSQSGALCTAVLDYARAKHIGFSKFISFGNKADISEIDLLFYLMEDEKTKVILLYLEEVSNGKELLAAAREVIQKSGKPILIIKSGRTEEGAAAAASHTGSLAGSDEICDAAFEQAGIIRCDNIVDMFNRAIAFAYQPAPKGDKVAIITNAGGPGVLTTDAAIKTGLRLAKFSDETAKYLKQHLPSTSNRNNPIDVIGDARTDRYNAAMTATFKDNDVNAVFVILTPQSMTDIDLIAREVAKVSSHYDKPVYASFMGEADVQEGIEVLQRNGIPHYQLPESMADALSCVVNFNKRLELPASEPGATSDINNESVHRILNKATGNNQRLIAENQAYSILKTYGFPTLPVRVVSSEEKVKPAANEIGYPQVMKIVSDDIAHKTEVGGIVLNIQNEDEAVEAYGSIVRNVKEKSPESGIQGIMIAPMIKDGVEVILGMKRDPSFGPVLMFGIGGIHVEIYKDVSFRVAPVSKEDAMSMIEAIRGYPLLGEFRGKKARDVQLLQSCIVRLGQLATECEQIRELDINPLILLDKGCYVADAKIMV
ncbi:MAG: acetate--CoA ligase family protein [Cytophagales bacterium]|nr:acetate--CoA ligase family protein [Cytophagales bacterium]